MTENEFLKYIDDLISWVNARRNQPLILSDLGADTAVKALREYKQYRAIGTVEECREARERQRVKDIIHNPDGGVDEDWLCPSCGRFCSPYTEHCQHCGQAVKVGDNP